MHILNYAGIKLLAWQFFFEYFVLNCTLMKVLKRRKREILHIYFCSILTSVQVEENVQFLHSGVKSEDSAAVKPFRDTELLSVCCPQVLFGCFRVFYLSFMIKDSLHVWREFFPIVLQNNRRLTVAGKIYFTLPWFWSFAMREKCFASDYFEGQLQVNKN